MTAVERGPSATRPRCCTCPIRGCRNCVAQGLLCQAEEPEMKWITREHVKVDRVACPWLIRKFVDPEAEFVFVPVEQVMSEVARLEAIPYDVQGVELGHHGRERSFEAILKRH